MGKDAQAAIKTGTLLGKRYLGITPGNGEENTGGDVIPLAQTTTPYNVSRSIESVTAQIKDFDKPKIEEALNVFSDTFKDTPENFKATFTNVKALSQTISSRDQALRELLQHANAVSGVLADRTGDFESILNDGNQLLAELEQRRELFQHLFERFNYVAEQARDFVKENNSELKGSLDELNQFLDILESNNANLSLALKRVASFITGLGEGVANGPSFSAVVGLHTVGDIANYTDVLRQGQNPQAPNIPGNPGLPGVGPLPNPLDQGPAGEQGKAPTPINPTNSGRENTSSGSSGLPLLGGN
jgi:phospholipid/cholesterol/gamma-HCH transport system substrate-binding protein